MEFTELSDFGLSSDLSSTTISILHGITRGKKRARKNVRMRKCLFLKLGGEISLSKNTHSSASSPLIEL